MTKQDKILPSEIVGAGGGSKSGGQPAPNTLRSNATTRILDAISEGDIHGLVNGAESIYLNETPLQNADGSFNFQNVTWQQRVGNPDDDHMNGHGAVESTQLVEVEVQNSVGPVTRTITNADADAVRVIVRINQLVQISDKGVPQTNTLHYDVKVRPYGGSWSTVVQKRLNNEKCTSPTQIAHRIELPVGGHPWDIRVERITPDTEDDRDQKSMTFESMVTLVEGRFTYPHTALVGLEMDAESIGAQIPQRAYHVRGRNIQVPSNYDAVNRTYTGNWDGTFKTSWSNNPVWVFYDLITNDRYGLGEFIDSSELSGLKWQLYTIGQYCDEKIPSGFSDGGNEVLEPRFTFNGVIRNRQEAYHALQSITTAFRGMGYWAVGQVFASADMPSDPVKLVTPSNVIDGRFSYSSTAQKARHSVALVRWNDPNDFYKPATELVINEAALAKHGWREKQIDLAGCTSRGGAHRYGKWALDVENNETETVEYKASFDHMDIVPGEIIAIADPRKASVRLGGRIVSHENHDALHDVVELDAETSVPNPTEQFIWLTKSSGELVQCQIRASLGDQKRFLIDQQAFKVENASVFIVTGEVEPRQYRILSINEVEQNIFQISALLHDPQKYDRVEQGLKFEPISYSREENAKPVQNLTGSELAYINDDGQPKTRVTLNWERPSGVVVREYVVFMDTPTETRKFVSTTKDLFVEVDNLDAGEYTFFVVTVDRRGNQSSESTYFMTTTGLSSIGSGVVSNLLLTDNPGQSEFLGRDVKISWTNAFHTSSENSELAENPALYDYNTIKIFHQPTNTLLNELKVRGETFVYSYEQNALDCASKSLGVPAARSLRFEVSVTSRHANTSIASVLTAANPLPGALTPSVSAVADVVSVSLPNNSATDIRGMKVWIEENDSFDPNSTEPKYDGNSSFVSWHGEFDKTYYVRAGYFDFFDDSIVVSPSIEIETSESIFSVTSKDTADQIEKFRSRAITPVIRSQEDLAEQASLDMANAFAEELRQRDELVVNADAIASEAVNRAQAILAESAARQQGDDAINVTIAALSTTVADNAAAIVQEAVARADQDGVLAADIAAILVTTAQNAAAIATEQTARADGDTANANAITALGATVGQNTADISAEQTARADGDAANAAAITSLGTTVSQNTAAISAEQTARADADTALSNDIAAVLAATVTNAAAITTEQTARADADTALANDITTLQATTATNAAAIVTEQTARINADNAIAADVTALTTSVGDNAAAIGAEQTARATQDTALAADIAALTVTVGTNTSDIASEQTTRATEDAALAADIVALTTTVGTNTSAITTEQTTRASEDAALAASIASVLATANGNTAAITTETNARVAADLVQTNDLAAYISSNDAAVASANSSIATLVSDNTAQASSIATLLATTNGHTTTINQQATAIAGMGGTIQTALNVNDHFSGWALTSEILAGGAVYSDFTFVADAFRIAGTGGSPMTPFAVYTAPRDINGVTVPAGTFFEGLVTMDQLVVTGSLSSKFATIGHFQSAASGERVEIEDNRFQVFDDSNQVRVKLGYLG